MKSWIVCASFLSCCVAFGQQPSGKIAFEVASIKPSKPQPMGLIRMGMNSDAGMVRYTGVSLKICICTAYRVKEFQVQGPDWLGSERFDITAKLPAGSTKDQIPEMLQDLLAERFKLTLHRDTKEHAIYALVVAKGGPKLKQAEVQVNDKAAQGGEPGKGGPPRGAMMMMRGPGGLHIKAPSATLARLSEMLSQFCERPVVDMTDVKGEYDFDFSFTPETMRGMPGGPRGPMPPPGGAERPPADAPEEHAASVFDAVRAYGLKLEPRKAPLEFLTIDHIEKEPTEN